MEEIQVIKQLLPTITLVQVQERDCPKQNFKHAGAKQGVSPPKEQNKSSSRQSGIEESECSGLQQSTSEFRQRIKSRAVRNKTQKQKMEESIEKRILSETLWELYSHVGTLKDDLIKMQSHLEQLHQYIDDVENAYSLEEYRQKER